MAWRVGNGASSHPRYTGALPAVVNSYTIFGHGIIRVNRGAASRLITLFDGLSGQYNVIQTDGAGTGLIFDPGNGAPLTSAVTIGIDVRFYWAIRVNGTGAGAASMHIRQFGSSTVTKVTTSNTNTFAPTRMDLGDSGFDERFDGELGNVIVYNSALSDAEIEAQFGKKTPQVSGYAAWWKTESTDLATSLLDETANNYDLTNEGATVTYAANFYDGNVVEVGNNTGDTGDVQDAEIYQGNPTDTLGADAAFYIGRFGAGDLDRTVLRGDFSSIPASATIVDATLFIWQSTDDGGQTYQIGAHKLLVPFVEAEVSWNNRALTPSTVAWATAGATGGADSVSSPSGLGTFNASNGAYKPITGLAALVQDWISNSSSNHGVLLKAQIETPDGSYKSFVSSEGADGNRPYWLITYLDGPSPHPVFAVPFTGTGPLGAGPVGVFQVRLTDASGTVATGTSSGQATASGQGAAVATSNGSSAGSSAAAGQGRALASSIGSTSGTATASGQGRATVTAIGSSAGASTASGDGKAVVTSTGNSSGTSTAAGEARTLVTSVGTASASSTAAGEGRATAVGVGSAPSSATAAGEGRANALAVGSSTGQGSAAGQGAAAISAVGASSGTSAAAGQGASTARAVGTSAGAGTGAGQGRATALGVGAAPGSATAAGEGKAQALANGSSAGSATAAGLGVGAAPAVGSSAGAATAAGQGKALARADGASPGASTAAGEGKALALATGTSAGTSTASGITGASSAATGTSAGTSTAAGEGRSLVAAVGTAPGTSTAAGVARSLVMATGSSSGISTADGVSGSALPPSTGTSAGAASTSGQGRATALGVGSSAGSSSGSGQARWLVTAIGNSAGTSTAQAPGGYAQVALGTAEGQAIVYGDARMAVMAIGVSAGGSIALGVYPVGRLFVGDVTVRWENDDLTVRLQPDGSYCLQREDGSTVRRLMADDLIVVTRA